MQFHSDYLRSNCPLGLISSLDSFVKKENLFIGLQVHGLTGLCRTDDSTDVLYQFKVHFFPSLNLNLRDP